MRRLATTLSGLLLSGLGGFGLVGLLGAGSVAHAQGQGAEPPVDIIEMSGLVDGVVTDDVEKAIERAAASGAQALVIQLNSKGAVVSPERMARLAEAIHGSEVPVAIWVGPSGARALSTPGQLLGAAAVTAMAPATRIGDFGSPLPVEGFELDFGNGGDQLRSFTLSPAEARVRNVLRLPIDDEGVPVLRNMLLAIDGLEHGGNTVNTAEERATADGGTELVLVAEPRFYKLPLLPRLMHTVASPALTYLLLTIGLSLLIFEFFTAGVGVAGIVGAACVVLAFYGLGVLPVNGWALATMLVAFFGLAIDDLLNELVAQPTPAKWLGDSEAADPAAIAAHSEHRHPDDGDLAELCRLGARRPADRGIRDLAGEDLSDAPARPWPRSFLSSPSRPRAAPRTMRTHRCARQRWNRRTPNR